MFRPIVATLRGTIHVFLKENNPLYYAYNYI